MSLLAAPSTTGPTLSRATTERPSAPRPSRSEDLAVLTELVDALEADVTAGLVGLARSRRLRDRFAAVGLLAPSAGTRELRQALADLGQRLRADRGELPAARTVPSLAADTELPAAR